MKARIGTLLIPGVDTLRNTRVVCKLESLFGKNMPQVITPIILPRLPPISNYGWPIGCGKYSDGEHGQQRQIADSELEEWRSNSPQLRALTDSEWKQLCEEINA